MLSVLVGFVTTDRIAASHRNEVNASVLALIWKKGRGKRATDDKSLRREKKKEK